MRVTAFAGGLKSGENRPWVSYIDAEYCNNNHAGAFSQRQRLLDTTDCSLLSWKDLPTFKCNEESFVVNRGSTIPVTQLINAIYAANENQ
jgi:hypothetical protein